jgi:hypothetical protein
MLQELRPENGAAEAARWLERLVSAPSVELAANSAANSTEVSRGWGSLGGRAARARVFVRTIPRTLLRLIGQTFSLPAPRTLILALGADEAAIRDALNRAQEAPERVLLVTDSLAIGEVWRAGTGVEHVPAAGERQAELTGIAYEEFRRRRLGLILAGRPRFRQALTAGEVPHDLVDAATAPPRRRARLLR